jgi:signal peptidase I
MGPLVPIAMALLLAVLLKAFVVDLVVVEGRSMLPTLRPGQVVVVLRAAYGLRLPPDLGGWLILWSLPKPGDLVVAENPDTGVAVVKRVDWEGSGPGGGGMKTALVYVLGDNPGESLDSRSYGALPVEKIAGRVLTSARRP